MQLINFGGGNLKLKDDILSLLNRVNKNYYDIDDYENNLNSNGD